MFCHPAGPMSEEEKNELPKVIFKRKTPLSVLRSQTHSQRHGNKSNSRLCDSLKVTSAARFQTGTGLVGSGPPVRQPLWWVSLSSRAITLHLIHLEDEGIAANKALGERLWESSPWCWAGGHLWSKNYSCIEMRRLPGGDFGRVVHLLENGGEWTPVICSAKNMLYSEERRRNETGPQYSAKGQAKLCPGTPPRQSCRVKTFLCLLVTESPIYCVLALVLRVSPKASLEPGQSPGLYESCQTQLCQWRVLKAGMLDIEEKAGVLLSHYPSVVSRGEITLSGAPCLAHTSLVLIA
ncbi:Protocadherin Fat 2, partial [Dissostichus eleginoides]